MKLKSLLTTAVIAASMLVPASAAQADCYWGPDGVLVVPDSGQCVIQIFPIGPVPPSATPGTPMATPSPSATPTPTATPKPTESEKPKPIVMRRIFITSVLHWEQLVSPNLPNVTIVSETDPKFSTGCGQVAFCALSVPDGHTLRIGIVSPYRFGVTSPQEKSLLLTGARVSGSFIASYKYEVAGNLDLDLTFVDNPFTMAIKNPVLPDLTFPHSSADNGVVNAGGFTVERNKTVEIAPTWAMSTPLSWQGLPPGLSMNANGSITGAPTKSGTYVVTARAGQKARPLTYRFAIEVTADITPPTITSSSAIDLTSLRYEFSPSTLPNQRSTDFYKTRVTTSNGTFVREILVDGGAKSALITGLSPSTSYNLSMVACNIAADTCSDSSAAATASTQQNPIVLRSSTSGVTTRSTWIAGSLDSMQTTIRGRTGQSFRLMNVGFGNATKAQREAFEDAFPGLQLASSGTITGTLKATNRKQEREFFQIGTVFVKFKITTTR